MKIIKQTIVSNPGVYSTCKLNLNGKSYLTGVSENPGEHAYIIDPETLEYKELWRGETGVMNVVQIDDSNLILAITKFYPIFQSKETCISYLVPGNDLFGTWEIRKAFDLPFCHRIGALKINGRNHLICCTLCKDKDFQDDWSKPGAVYVTPIPEKAEDEWKVYKIYEGLTKNHGLFIGGENKAYVGSENGIMEFDFSTYKYGETLYPKLIATTPTSDVWINSFDGTDYMATIEPFHGTKAALYRFCDTCFEEIWAKEIVFGHVVWSGTVFGRMAVIVGDRGGNKTLDLTFIDNNETIIIDEGVGPTQITAYQDGTTFKVFTAGHGSGEVILYTLEN